MKSNTTAGKTTKARGLERKEDTRGLMDQYGEPQAQFPGSSRGSIANPPAESQRGAHRRNRQQRKGTAAEVRRARLMPWERGLLAISLRDVRRIYGGDSRRAAAADRRLFALRHDSTAPADLRIDATGCTSALLIRARAAARFMRVSEADFISDALAFAVEAATEVAGVAGLPYTRHERDALARLGKKPDEGNETELQ